jgi:LTXXQ motif family protein
MRQSHIGAGPSVLASLLLLCPALAIGAQADPRHGGGGPAPAAPHVAAPAPHVAAPAPHVAAPAPHVSAPAPHVSAPAPHFAAPATRAAPPAPHFAAPHVAAPHVAAPRIAPHAAPHVAAPRVPHGQGPRIAAPHAAPHVAAPHVAAPRATPHHGAPTVAHGRHGPAAPNVATGNVSHGNVNHGLAARPSTATGGNRHALAPVNQPHNAPNATVGNAPSNGPNRQHNIATPNTVGQGAAGPGRNAAGAVQQNTRAAGQNTRGSRVLTNSVLANAPGRDAASRSLARSTFRGHFAQSPWARDFARDRQHHRHSGLVLGFVGPVFWPYAYDDFIDYTFWPAAYDDFWPYAYDDVFEGIYGGYAPDYGTYYAGGGSYGENYAGGPASSRRGQRRVATRGGTGGGSAPQAPLVCSGDAKGLTDFPIERIAQQVQPDQTQQGLLDELRDATEKAVQILQAACPTDLPTTPTGRLAALRTRDQAMLQAVQVVRPALEKFYEALGDEQKERFNALDQQAVVATTGSGRGQSPQDVSQLCNKRQSPMAGLPIDLIRNSLRLNDAQNAALQQLTDASTKAADILNASCSTDQALTPPGRLGAMEQRLQAMLQAIDTVQPALEHFYTSLSDEQKARFDRIGVRPT